MENKVTKFVELVIAKLKGDENQVIAIKNERKASNGFKSQLASLDSKLSDKETELEEAKEALESAICPTNLISDINEYFSVIKNKRERMLALQDEVEMIKESIEWFKEQQAKYFN